MEEEIKPQQQNESTLSQQLPEQFDELPLEVIQAAKNLGLNRDDLDDDKIKSKLLTIYEHFKKQEPTDFPMFVRKLNSDLGLINGIEPLDKLFMHVYMKAQKEDVA